MLSTHPVHLADMFDDLVGSLGFENNGWKMRTQIWVVANEKVGGLFDIVSRKRLVICRLGKAMKNLLL